MSTLISDVLEERFLLQKEYMGESKPVNKLAPLVSVTVTTYQQEPYIRECLEGILMQKTNFPYEIIIGEDGSTDATRDICKEYAEKYPDKIRLFLRDRNISHYKTETKAFRFNGVFTRMAARGKYTAICEGDDYWIDPKKIQKQVDFLVSNLNCSVCFHNAFIINASLINHVSCFNIPNNGEICTTKDLFEKSWFVPTASIIFRTSDLPKRFPEWYLNAQNGDLALLFLLSKRGALGVIPGYLSVYRQNAINSISRVVKKRPDFFALKYIELLKSANLYFNKEYDDLTRRKCARLYISIAKIRLKNFFSR